MQVSVLHTGVVAAAVITRIHFFLHETLLHATVPKRTYRKRNPPTSTVSFYESVYLSLIGVFPDIVTIPYLPITMASTPRAPKQWVLKKNGTVNSFESWKQNLLFTLKLEPSFALS